MSSAAVGTHSSGAGPLSLMSCVRESSPPIFDSDTEKGVASKRRFWNPKRWFRRKAKVAEDGAGAATTDGGAEIGKDALRSRSASELSVADEDRRRSSSSMHPGLSVSHDSVFHSPNSGSDMELDAAQSSSSLSISQPIIDLRLQTELSERLRLRRSRGDTSEDDEGLPRSPCNSPTASDGLLRDKNAIKDLPTKSHSTCSDGSLLSMGSYEDEDSFGPQSRHSSKLSLHEKKPTPDSSFELAPSSATVPLNHSAAHHRVSVKPKRTHGPPRRKRGQQLSIALPATPEVNEDSSIRSLSPEISKKDTLTELYSMSSSSTVIDTQIKCSSLPPGLTAPGADTGKLNRSKSNAGSKSRDSVAPSNEEERQEKLSLLDRIFPRRSGRKKKKEAKLEVEAVDEAAMVQSERQGDADTETISTETTDSPNAATHSHTDASTTKYTATTTVDIAKPVPAPRHGVSSRQRVLPIDIPETPEEVRRDAEPLSPEKSLPGTSPLQIELENRFRQRQISLSTSPPPVPIEVEMPPLSPRSPKSPRTPGIPEAKILPTVISSSEQTFYVKSSVTTRSADNKRSEEFKSKIKMPGLSSLQQRALTLNADDHESNFKSLTDFAYNKTHKPLAKSHSFKETKIFFDADTNVVNDSTAAFLTNEIAEENKNAINKAASLDSIKHSEEEPIHLSELKFDLKKSTKTDDEKQAGNVFDNISKTLITITGPSHTPTVTITSNKESFSSSSAKTIETGMVDGSRTISIKESQVSVTKIQVEQKSAQFTQLEAAPEFVNKKLHKVEIRPTSNIILSIKSPKAEEPTRPKTLFSFDNEPDRPVKPPAARKFSKENLEIVEKPDSPTIGQEEKNARSRSASLDSLQESDKSSQDSLDKLDEQPVVVLRRKSVAGRRRDEEPELMKVFARRSLKLKDGDLDALQESLCDPSDEENRASPVALRRSFTVVNRAVSANAPRTVGGELLAKRQASIGERRRTDQWIANIKNEEEEEGIKDRVDGDVIDSISPRSDFITEPKNFSQRKAEWEKRAQLAQKKTAY